MILLVAATDRELCGHGGLVCGVGPVEAAAATARTLALQPVEAVLHVGIAGARGLEPGTVVVGTEAVYCDLRAAWPVVDRVAASPELVETAAAALATVGSTSPPRLPISTSAAVGAASDTVSLGPIVEGMEGFGVLRAAALADVPAVEVRAISNAIGEPDRSRWDVDGALAALGRAMPLVLGALGSAGRT